MVGLKRQRQPQANEDNPDIFHRAVGQQSFQILLHHCVQHAQRRRNSAQRQHQSAPPPHRFAQQIEHDADEAVHRHLGHHPAHQRRNVAGRGGMRQRQPHVQRNQARLGTRAKQRQRQDQRRPFRGDDASANRGKVVTAIGASQQAEGQ